MKIAPVHLVWKKPRIFIPAFTFPLLASSVGWYLTPAHWPYYLVTLGSAFVITLTLIESLTSGEIADNWGRLSRNEHPVRYWLQIAVWSAMYLCTLGLPIILRRLQTA